MSQPIPMVTFNILTSGQCAHLLPSPDEKLKTIIITGPQGSGKTLNSQKLAQHFGCNLIIEEWDGVSPCPKGSLVLTNSESFNCTLADEIHDIASALLAIQNITCNVASNANLSE